MLKDCLQNTFGKKQVHYLAITCGSRLYMNWDPGNLHTVTEGTGSNPSGRSEIWHILALTFGMNIAIATSTCSLHGVVDVGGLELEEELDDGPLGDPGEAHGPQEEVHRRGDGPPEVAVLPEQRDHCFYRHYFQTTAYYMVMCTRRR